MNELDRLQIKAAVVESNLDDIESDHGELVQAVRSALDDCDSARSKIIEAIRYSKAIPLFVFDKSTRKSARDDHESGINRRHSGKF